MRTTPLGFWRHLGKKPPKLLWHYTSLEAFMKIVESSSLLASDARYVNDTKELIHVLDQMLERLNELLRHSHGPNNSELGGIREILERGFDDPVYVLSFSEKDDDLSQWRGYTPSTQGICFGVSTSSVQQSIKTLKSGFHQREIAAAIGKIIYLPDGSGATFDSFLGEACKYIDVIDGEIVRSIAFERLMKSALPFYKHVAFKGEAEWRVRVSVDASFGGTTLPAEFRVGKSMLIPAFRLRLENDNHFFIREVIVGPTPHKEASVQSVKAYLDTQGFPDVIVRSSQVPYRSW